MIHPSFIKMTDLALSGKRVMIREDLNVPMDQGNITNIARLERALPTIKKALAADAQVMLLSHLGRPNEGTYDAALSLAPVATALSQLLGQEVSLARNWLDGIDVDNGQVVLCENVRFNAGEKKNDVALAQRMAKLCDVFVMDAFATAHRAEASTAGVSEFAKTACAGPLLVEELHALSQALEQPKRPLVAIVGGSKVSTKIELLNSLLAKVDCLIVGGGIANTLLAAKGHAVGKSLYEADWLERAQVLLEQAKEQQVAIPLPVDVIVATEFSKDATPEIKTVDAVTENDMILDVGPNTAKQYIPLMKKAGTIVWNGPVGVFELPPFAKGTQALGAAIAASSAFSIAGGGDTLAALDQFNIADHISYVSTGGGAFLAFLQGEMLPAVAALEKRARQ